MQIGLIAAMIVVGALAYRSATYIYREIQGGFAGRLAVQFSRSPARLFLTVYVIAGLPLAFLNGYLLRLSWIEGVIVGIGTWIGMLLSIRLARRFNPTLQFFLFSAVNLIWLAFDLVVAVTQER